MEMKKVFGVFCLVLVLAGSVSAITGSIGNVRMILRAEVGDEIEKYVLVKNVNNVSVDIEVFATGNLSIEVLDDVFRLEPGGEKRAQFVINVDEEGTNEGSVNVKFTQAGEKNGVGLMSTVIVVAEKGSFWNWENDGSVISGNVVGSSGGVSFVLILLVVVIFVLVVLIVVVLALLRKGGKK